MYVVTLDQPIPFEPTDLGWLYLFDTSPADLPEQDAGDDDDDPGLSDEEVADDGSDS